MPCQGKGEGNQKRQGTWIVFDHQTGTRVFLGKKKKKHLNHGHNKNMINSEMSKQNGNNDEGE